jgi:putative hydrolase of the HAD superfamily
MGQAMSFAPFKVLTFDVVGTLIDFERGIIDYVRTLSHRPPAELADEAILTAYRRSRGAPGAGWYPDDLVRVYQDMARELGLPQGPGAAEGL